MRTFRTSPFWALLLLLAVATSAAAEYCKTQGSPAVPKSQTPAFDEQAFLIQSEIIASESKHLPWGRPECPHILFQKEKAGLIARTVDAIGAQLRLPLKMKAAQEPSRRAQSQ
jgi:hypothetical protein